MSADEVGELGQSLYRPDLRKRRRLDWKIERPGTVQEPKPTSSFCAPRAVVLPEALHSDLGRTRQDIRAAKGIGLRAELQGERTREAGMVPMALIRIPLCLQLGLVRPGSSSRLPSLSSFNSTPAFLGLKVIGLTAD
ncbi:hypothetical protein VNO78_35214 [Psophocarpus tetragonolobus]|uniref:Uncharacterized protein n=1 Tax=Psophocarpus tetragonolobus TaxID=3891 RepID=A0AAN9NM92_PSOTE